MGFIGTDKSGESATETWFPTAPTASEPEREDKVTCHEVCYNSDGTAYCDGVEQQGPNDGTGRN